MTKILEGNIIKKANTKQKYTKEQINQLRKCSAANEDGHYYFMENFGHLKHTSKGRVLFKPFDYQKRLIDNYHNYRFSINMLGR
jgi:ABC-type oligopeptide transport system ATPase subunit